VKVNFIDALPHVCARNRSRVAVLLVLEMVDLVLLQL
jgi:hypothetical protein